jgi:5-methylthioribose kinase
LNDCNAKAGSPGISEAALDIERPEELTAYLIAQGFLPEDDCATVRVLPGGVSNRTMLVESAARGRFVVKQALGRLRVQAEWHAAPERIHREARALEYLGDIIGGGAVPRLLFEDRERHIIAMTAVGEPHANWKQLLLTGVIDLDHARQFTRRRPRRSLRTGRISRRCGWNLTTGIPRSRLPRRPRFSSA